MTFSYRSDKEACMKAEYGWLLGVLALAILICCLSCGKESGEREAADEGGAPAYTTADTLYWDLLIAYLREHFDDFHDVTMRYHHQDHTINGVVEIKMTWENRVLKSAEVLANGTGSDDLPGSLIEKMRKWEIAGLDGPAEITLPVNVKLVGLDDPDFPNTAIVTGEVRDTEGNPLHGAMMLIKPEVAGRVYRAETNREGIFVRTLVPPGIWDLECSLEGYETALKQGVSLVAGQHMPERVVLKKL
jgi:hypothetical protein